MILQGGLVVDGTGAPARRADVVIEGDRIVSVGESSDGGGQPVDVSGCVVAPGFVDIHTHYDAQLLWDPTASPSPLHGVTTVIGGNCGFSIAPLGDGDADYVMRMMARVEGMSLDTLQHGPAWDWHGFGEWLGRLADGGAAVNAGFLAGHSTLRRVAMGDGAHEVATPEQIEEMVRLLHQALAEGALGFSSSLGEAHTDYEGRPVPSRLAGFDEFLALAGAVADHPGTTLEFIPAMGQIPAERIALMTDMALAAGRSLNWNLLGSLSPTEVYEQQLTACDHARERGAEVVALALPDLLQMRAPLGPDPDWDLVVVAEGPSAGRTVASVAASTGSTPESVAAGQAVATLFPSLTPSLGASPESWEVRGQVWRDDRVVLGGSDAGAHCDLMCHANYPTVVLGQMTRERGLFGLEDAVRRMTEVPSRLYGLKDRGRVAPGYFADLVVFDPDSVGTRPTLARHDQPAGGMRLYAEADGVRTVYVNGRAIVADGAFTGDLPGRVMRSGVDTD